MGGGCNRGGHAPHFGEKVTKMKVFHPSCLVSSFCLYSSVSLLSLIDHCSWKIGLCCTSEKDVWKMGREKSVTQSSSNPGGEDWKGA